MKPASSSAQFETADNAREHELLQTITELCEAIAWQKKQKTPLNNNEDSERKDAALDRLFTYTKRAAFPDHIRRLADAIGLMCVSLEISDMRNAELVSTLRHRNKELEAALSATSTGASLNPVKSGAEQDVFVADSPPMKYVTQLAYAIAPYPINVLLLGESGTGKEVFAKLIHNASPRKNEPFIAVNCTAIPDSLFESEMFGIDKGVATGVTARTGIFASANKGTLFLDEIGDMSLPNQAKLLRALEAREITPVGKTHPIPLDIRVITATNCNLEQAVADKKFREDLYYRLNVAEITLPALSDRGTDIVELAALLLTKQCAAFKKKPAKLSPKAKKLLLQYSWPGNVRELNNEMERAAALAEDSTILPQHLSARVQDRHVPKTVQKKLVISTNESTTEATSKTSTQQTIRKYVEDEIFNLEKLELEIINHALQHTGNNKSKAAQLLGVTREGLRKKLQRLQRTT